jgi:hypothetical protein
MNFHTYTFGTETAAIRLFNPFHEKNHCRTFNKDLAIED